MKQDFLNSWTLYLFPLTLACSIIKWNPADKAYDNGNKHAYKVEAQVRFWIMETSCGQKSQELIQSSEGFYFPN